MDSRTRWREFCAKRRRVRPFGGHAAIEIARCQSKDNRKARAMFMAARFVEFLRTSELNSRPEGITAGDGRLRRSSGFAWQIRVEPGTGQAVLGDIVLHEMVPDKSRAGIFGHQQSDADVDPDYIRAVPVGERIESIDITVLLPDARLVFFADIF